MQKLLAAFCFLFLSQGYCKTLIISDIDDTIRSLHCQGSYLEMYDNSANPDRAFRGMSQIYNQLSGNGDLIFYVTAAVEPFIGMSQDFLTFNQFPQSENYFYKGWLEDTFEYKVSQIRQIIQEANADQIILIGDNGDRDVEVYATIEKEYLNVTTYIHKLYPGIISSGQNIYLTSVDLATALQYQKLLSEGQVDTILNSVLSDLEGQESDIINLLWPDWAVTSPDDVQQAFMYLPDGLNSKIKLEKIKTALFY